MSKLTQRYQALATRERLLLWLAASVLLVFPLWSYLIEPWQQQQQQAQQRLTQQQSELLALLDERTLLEIKLGRDPNAEFNQLIEQLTQQLREVDSNIDQHLQRLVTPQQMPLLLQQLLSNAQPLLLTQLHSLPPEPLLAEANHPNNLYLHGISMRLQGDYFSLMKYLQALQQLDKQLYWRSMDYQVQEYPQASVLLVFYTLSSSKEFIRVD